VHAKCKHQAAILLALIAIRDYSDMETAPALFHRPGMGRFDVPDSVAYTMVEAHLTWVDFVKRLVGDFCVPDGNTLRKEKLEKKKRKRKLYCYCQKPSDSESKNEDWKSNMVECCSVARECKSCHLWYHLGCLENGKIST